MPKQKKYKFSSAGSILLMLTVLIIIGGGGFAAWWFLLRKKVCSGHGKKQDGKCVCDDGWAGDDCSVSTKSNPTTLTTLTFSCKSGQCTPDASGQYASLKVCKENCASVQPSKVCSNGCQEDTCGDCIDTNTCLCFKKNGNVCPLDTQERS